MGKKTIQRIGIGLLLSGLLAATGALAALDAVQDAAPEGQGRADVLIIDTLKTFGALERPPVVFYHDRHTEALAKEGKDCAACHEIKDGRMSILFKRTADADKTTAMDIYHDNCITCHKETKAAGKPSGPLTCGQCHVENASPDILRQPIDLDRSLHYRHVKAADKKCEQCHHEYNAQEKKLFYAKGQEGACLYCHKEQTEENRISNRLASHLACVDCHRRKAAQKQDAGPVQCAGCHDPKQQALIEKVPDAPRIERNQPDVVLVKADDKPAGSLNPEPRENHMGVVPFDHKAHEAYNDTCKVCHHESLQSCVSCHTFKGKKEGGMVKLVQSMHQKNADMSCVGCHNQQQEKPQCAGCHHSMSGEKALAAEASCLTCHQKETMAADPASLDDAAAKALAAELLAARTPVVGTIAADQIPETVTIKKLADQYEPVALPHRKIVMKLAEVQQTSKLAAYYHKDPLTLCQGCHHNSPPAQKPPECGSCHGRSSEALNLTRPGLLAAYHQQCIECHDQMGIQKPASRDCTACHAKRK